MLSPRGHPCSSHPTYDAQTAYSHKSQTIAIFWVNALWRALILYNISHFQFACHEFSVVSTDETDAYHNLVIFGQKLRVERTGNVKLLSYLPGGLFDLKVKQVEIVLKTKHGSLNPPIHKLHSNHRPFISSDTILAASKCSAPPI